MCFWGTKCAITVYEIFIIHHKIPIFTLRWSEQAEQATVPYKLVSKSLCFALFISFFIYDFQSLHRHEVWAFCPLPNMGLFTQRKSILLTWMKGKVSGKSWLPDVSEYQVHTIVLSRDKKILEAWKHRYSCWIKSNPENWYVIQGWCIHLMRGNVRRSYSDLLRPSYVYQIRWSDTYPCLILHTVQIPRIF